MGFSLKKSLKKAANVVVAGTVGALTGGSAGAVGATVRQAVRESEKGKPTALNLRSVGQSAVTGVATSVAASLAASTVAPVPGPAAVLAKGATLLKAGGAKLAGLVKGGGLAGALPGLLKRGAGIVRGSDGEENLVEGARDGSVFSLPGGTGALDVPLLAGRAGDYFRGRAGWLPSPSSENPAPPQTIVSAPPVVVAGAGDAPAFNPMWLLAGLVAFVLAFMLMGRRRLV